MAKEGFYLIKKIDTRESRLEALTESILLLLDNRKEHQRKNRKAFSMLVDEWVMVAKEVLQEN